MQKGLLFKLHMITGLVSGIFIFMICLSGSILVFHEEFEQMADPTVAIVNQPMITVDSAYGIVKHTYPNAQVSNCTIPESVNNSFVFSIYDSSYKRGTKAFPVFVHPQTAVAMSVQPGNNPVIKWLSVFHNSFHLGKKGEWLLGVAALLFLVSLVSGSLIYGKKLLPVLFFRKRVYSWSNLHQLIGTWALVFNLMIAVTGFWMQRYVFKKSFYQSDNYTPVFKSSPPLFFKFDSAYDELKKQHPDFTGYVVYFAQSEKSKTAIYGSNSFNSFIHSKKFADAVFLDSAGGIARTAFVNDIDADSRYDIINAQVHYGQYGGWPLKIIYSLFGISGALLSITGFIMWFRRKKRKQGAN